MPFRCVKQAQNIPEEWYTDAGTKMQMKTREKTDTSLLFL